MNYFIKKTTDQQGMATFSETTTEHNRTPCKEPNRSPKLKRYKTKIGAKGKIVTVD
jgi:hypothetical protein